MADKLTDEIKLLFRTSIEEKDIKEVSQNIKSALENAVITFDEAEIKKEIVPVIQMLQKLFAKAEMKFNADKLLAMPSREALQKIANISVDKFQVAFDRALAKSGGVKIDFGNADFSALTTSLGRVEKDLERIADKIANTTKKSVSDIEESIRRLNKVETKTINSKKPVEGSTETVKTKTVVQTNKLDTTVDSIEKLFADMNSGNKTNAAQIRKAYEKYIKTIENNDPWEVQYQAIVEYVAKFESLSVKTKARLKDLPNFEKLYESLLPKSGAAKTSLQNLVSTAKGGELAEYKNQPWARESTLKKVEQVLRNGITVKDGGKADDDPHRKARSNLDVGNGADDGHSVASSSDMPPEIKAKVSAEQEALELDRKRRAEAEAIAKTEKKAAEKKRIEEEKITKAIKERAPYEMYRAVQSPKDSGKSKEDALADYGAEIWAKDKESAISYANDHRGVSSLLSAKIRPVNPLVFDAQDNFWSDYDQIPGLKEFFPGLLQYMQEHDEFDTQKYIHEKAKELGFDSVIFENVRDNLDAETDPDADTTTTIAVLDDRIVSLTGSFAQLEQVAEDGSKIFARELSNVPDYYVTSEDSGTEKYVEDLKARQVQINAAYEHVLSSFNATLSEQQRLLQEAKAQLAQNPKSSIAQKHVDEAKESIKSTQGIIAKFQEQMQYNKKALQVEIDSYEQMLGATSKKSGESKILSESDAFKQLVDYIGKSGKIPSEFFDGIISDSQQLDEDLKKILTSLGMFDSQGSLNIKSIRDGFSNLGGAVSDAYALISREGHYLPKAQDLMPKLLSAKEMGASVGEIVDIFEDQVNGRIYELQRTMPGTVIPDSTDVLEATDEQILKLIHDLEVLHKTGLYIDFGGDNILYDKEKGFSFIDLATKPQDGQDTTEGMAQEFLRYTKSAFKDGSFSGFESKFTNAANSIKVESIAHQENTAAIVEETKAVEQLNEEKVESQQIDVKENVAATVEEPVIVTQPVDEVESKSSIQTEELRQLLSAITYNVKVVQDAEPAEDNKIAIDTDALKSVLNNIVYNVKIAHDDTDKQANKIAIDESVLDLTLKRVFANILNPHTEQNDSEIKNEPWALDKTLLSVKEVLDGIHANTTKTESVEIAPAHTEVGNVLATENTLAAIKTAVESINTKVVKGTKAKTSESDGGKKTGVGKKNAESYAGSQYFPEKLKTQTMYLAKFRAKLMTTGKLTDDVDAKIYELLDGLKMVQNGPDFSKWNQQFLQLKTSVGIADIFDEAEDKEVSASYKEIIELQKLRNKLELDYEKAKDGSSLKQFYAEQLAQMDQAIAKQQIILDNEEYEAKLANMRAEQARKLGELEAKAADKDAKKASSSAKKLAQREAMLGKAGNAVGRAENTWMSAIGIEGELPDGFMAEIDEYYWKLDALRKKHQELKNSDMISEEQKKDLINQTMSINKLTDKIGGLISEYQKLSGSNVDETKTQTTALTNKSPLADYEAQLKQYARSITDGKAQIKSFNAETKTLTYTVKTGKNEFTEYTAAVRHLDNQLVSVQGTTKRTETFFEATARKMKELTSYFSGMAIFNRVGQELRRGIQYVREIDLALTELRKVTDQTEEEYDQFLQTAAKTGAKLGTTISAVTEATATFAKLGYTMEQATDMAESAIVYKNVGDNIESTEDAADSIISTMKGFKLEATEAMAIVDRFNEVGNRFAITSRGIGEALRLSASALSEGGNSLDESIGLITAANEVVNDPSSVGKNKLADNKVAQNEETPEKENLVGKNM